MRTATQHPRVLIFTVHVPIITISVILTSNSVPSSVRHTDSQGSLRRSGLPRRAFAGLSWHVVPQVANALVGSPSGIVLHSTGALLAFRAAEVLPVGSPSVHVLRRDEDVPEDRPPPGESAWPRTTWKTWPA